MSLKWLLALTALGSALIPIWKDLSNAKVTKKGKILNWALAMLACAATGGLIWQGYAEESETNTAKSELKEIKENQRGQAAMMQKIGAGLGDEQSYAEFFKTTENLVKQIAESKSRGFLENVNRAATETAGAREALQLENARAEARAKVQWEPLHLYIFNSFDTKIRELEKGGFVLSHETIPSKLISTFNDLTEVRRVHFAGGKTMIFYERNFNLKGGRISATYANFFICTEEGRGNEHLGEIEISEKGLNIRTQGISGASEILLSEEKQLNAAENMSLVESLISEMLMKLSLEAKDRISKKQAD